MRIRVSLIVCILVFSAVWAHAAPVFDAAAQKRIDDAVVEAISRQVTPSCCVVVGTADKVLFAKAYGRLTYDKDAPAATLDTLYDLASVSKAVGTTSATMLLVQDGKLSLDDPVSKYLPSWNSDDKRAIKLRNLITHTSGLPAYTSAEKAEATRKPGESHADALIKYIASLPLSYKTGEGYIYACLNFLTLARVNEEVAGVSQETLLRRRLFVPLGMTNTGWYLSDAKKAMAAPTIGGEHFRQGVVHDPLAYYYRDGYRCSGNAGLFSTANDLSKFCAMILSNGSAHGRQIFTPGTIDLFGTNQLPESMRQRQAIGWAMYRNPPSATPMNKDPKTAAFGHNGYTGTYVHFDRYAGTYIIVLTNRVYPDDKTSDYGIRSRVLRVVLESDPMYKGLMLPPPRPAQ